MSDTSVQTAPAAPGSAAAVPPIEAPPVRPPISPAYRALRAVASLRLTVVLFVLSLLLVFFGTLAQIDVSIWTTVEKYFRSGLVWVPWQLLVKFGQKFFWLPSTMQMSGTFPFPGGWLLGTLLLVNLLAAHLVRFKVSWKRAGILLIHGGLILLMLGELVTGLFAVESRMTLAIGERVNFLDVSQKNELAITTADPDDATHDRVVVVPDRLLHRPGRVSDERLPFDIEVIEYWKNSNLVPGAPHGKPVANARRTIDGQVYGLVPDAETAGVDTEGRDDIPAVKVAFYRKGADEKLGEAVLSLWYYPNKVNRTIEFPPQTVTVDGRTYTVDYRPVRVYRDYQLTLKEFKHDKYLGTSTAKNFSSLVELQAADGERREIKIFMNHPLRHAGETFYQSGYFPDNSGTILQVVRNPGWLLPYLSCAIVTLGMAIHFSTALVHFLSRRAAS